MKFPAKAGGDFEPVPAGNHVAICNAVVDLGLQKGSGMYPDPKPQVYIRFELPTERVKYEKDGQTIEGPMSIGKRFTASMSEKANLRKFIEGWFGKKFPSNDAAADFDLELLLGKKCLLNVTHTEKGDKTYANLSSAAPLPKGMAADYPQHNKSIAFDLSKADDQTFRLLPEWLQKVINERLEEPKTNGRAPTPSGYDEYAGSAGDPNDDVPF